MDPTAHDPLYETGAHSDHGLYECIYKMLKNIHQNSEITTDAVACVNTYLERFTQKIFCLALFYTAVPNEKDALSAGSIQKAVQQIFPAGELIKNAISEGTRACMKLNSSYDQVTESILGALRAGESVGEAEIKSITRRAGLTFPIAHIGKEFVSYLGEADTSFELSSFGTVVYLTAVLEYLSAEILELSGNTCQAAGLKVVSVDHVEKAIKDDAELKQVLHERQALSIPSPGAEIENGSGCDADAGAEDGVDKDDGGNKGGGDGSGDEEQKGEGPTPEGIILLDMMDQMELHHKGGPKPTFSKKALDAALAAYQASCKKGTSTSPQENFELTDW